MLLLLKNIQIVDGQTTAPVDLLIRDGVIEAIGKDLSAEPGARIWSQAGACVSPGWMDVGVQTGDPGYEHREDLESATRAAAAGGFTAIACFPNTHPAVHSKSEVLYIQHKTAGGLVHIHPIGAVSVDCAGKDLAEMYDMHAAGAVAFSDGGNAVQDAGLMLRALQYARAFDGLVMNTPYHKSVAAGGQMHEGVASTMLGMKGIPALAEELMIQRDLSLMSYAESRLHLHLVSTAKGVAMVRAAKKAGLPVTCSVAIANLCFTDKILTGVLPAPLKSPGEAFDAAWKILPPLREQADVEALLEGLADDTIDFICSNHTPWDEEAKNLEFPYAEFGMTAMETIFALCRTFLRQYLPLPKLVEKMAIAPRRVLGLSRPEIKPGAPAVLTVFAPDQPFTFTEKDFYSKSRNTPFMNQSLTGKVLGIINQRETTL